MRQLRQLGVDFVKYPSRTRVGKAYENSLQPSQLSQTVADYDIGGLCALFRKLAEACDCEDGFGSDECREARLDRWWIAVLTGHEAEVEG